MDSLRVDMDGFHLDSARPAGPTPPASASCSSDHGSIAANRMSGRTVALLVTYSWFSGQKGTETRVDCRKPEPDQASEIGWSG